MVLTQIVEQELHNFLEKKVRIHHLHDPGNFNSFVFAGGDFSVLEQNQSTSEKTISFTLLLRLMNLQKDIRQ